MEILEKFAIIDMVRSKTPSTSNYKFKENNKMLQTSLRRSLKTPQKGINSNFSVLKRKAQEEIVGFVAVVVLVAIVALVLLSFSFRSKGEARDSREVAQFLDSAMEYTTNCSFFFGSENAKVGDVFRACSNEERCSDGEESCKILNETLPLLIGAGLRPGEDRPIKGYLLSAGSYGNLTRDTSKEEFIRIEGGNCTSYQTRGTSEFRPSRGGKLIEVKLDVCS